MLGRCSVPRREAGAGALVWHLLTYEMMPLPEFQIAQHRGTHQLTQHLGVDDPEAHRPILTRRGQRLPIGAEGHGENIGPMTDQDLRGGKGAVRSQSRTVSSQLPAASVCPS